MKQWYFVAITIIFVVYLAFFAVPIERGFKVVFFDVGQGDAAFFRTPEGYSGLIDGGPGKIVLSHLGKELPFFERKLDVIILTHPHRDHVEGLIQVLRYYDVSLLIVTGVTYESHFYDQFWEEIRTRNIPFLLARSDNDVVFPDGTILDVIWPAESLSGMTFTDINASSIVTRLSYADFSIMLSGDTTAAQEDEMIRTPVMLTSRVLKAAHHGSKTSSSDDFLESVSPETAVISSGAANRFGHPHKEVLARLRNHGVKIRRTEQEGNITMIYDSS